MGDKVFVYGLQSSGASLFAYFLGQASETIVVPDLWNSCLAPRFSKNATVVLKATVNKRYEISRHHKFCSRKRILFLRDPVQNYLSLRGKVYRNQGGRPEEKLKLLDGIFANWRESFDVVVAFEDFLYDLPKVVKNLKEVGVDADLGFKDFPRSKEEVLDFDLERSLWCRRNYNKRWGFGNINFGFNAMEPKFYEASEEVEESISRICPKIYEFFKNLNYNLKKSRPSLEKVATRN